MVTDQAFRGQGLAGRLNMYAVEKLQGQPIRITAEDYLEQWYGKFGFVSTGNKMVIEGIGHVEMTLGV